MRIYSVNVYKTLLNDQGHNYKCLQRQFKVSCWDPVEAMASAQQMLDARLSDADCIEVVQESRPAHALQVGVQ